MAAQQTRIGQAPTNPRAGSLVVLPALPRYRVTCVFVPKAHGPWAHHPSKYDESQEFHSSLYFLAFPGQDDGLKQKLPKLSLWMPAFSPADGRPVKKSDQFQFQSHTIETGMNVQSGDIVKLYFARSALKKHREKELLSIGPVTRNCVVVIFERPGKIGEDHSLTLEWTESRNNTDYFHAFLTGDNWMACSPPFTAADARALLSGPSAGSSDVPEAVASIYDGPLETPTPGFYPGHPVSDKDCQIIISYDKDQTPRQLAVLFAHANNCDDNITDYKASIPVSRVHPNAYAAVIDAAIETGLTAIVLSNSWRPMLGSWAHRHGLGLDVSWIFDEFGGYPMAWTATGQAKDALEKLRSAYEARKKCEDDYTTAKKKYKQAKKNAGETQKALADANTQKALADANTEVAKAQTKREDARKILEDARKIEDAATPAWRDAVNSHQPQTILRFRESLERQTHRISQILDPWYMDEKTGSGSTHDVQKRTDFNLDEPGLQHIHRNHLHVTARDPEFDVPRKTAGHQRVAPK